MRHLYIFAGLLLCLSCGTPNNNEGVPSGIISSAKAGNSLNLITSDLETLSKDGIANHNETWSFDLKFKGETLPFQVKRTGDNYRIINGKEIIYVNDVVKDGDTTILDLPVFNSELRFARVGDKISGKWYNLAKENYSIPFDGRIWPETRFEVSAAEPMNCAGKWEVKFSPGTNDEYPAIGVFEQNRNKITGTFLTETGDYRYLEGNVDSNKVMLSCFDGAHAFLFKAELNEKGELEGKFFSGKHWEEPWKAKRNENVALTDPYKLTYLVDSTEKFDFSFPNLDNKPVSLSDKQYQNKVVIVQIMGSWCPNCMDETAFLSSLYSSYHPKGLEVVSVCFESSSEFDKNVQSVSKLKEHFGTSHEYLIAGCAGKKCAGEKLPQLNHIMSYPTSLFIDKQGKVRKIHTGFYGPGTGPYYEMYVEKTTVFIEKLLSEGEVITSQD